MDSYTVSGEEVHCICFIFCAAYFNFISTAGRPRVGGGGREA